MFSYWRRAYEGQWIVQFGARSYKVHSIFSDSVVLYSCDAGPEMRLTLEYVS